MAAGKGRSISQADLDRAVRSVAEHFGTSTVYVIGSQALLVGREDIARDLRFSQDWVGANVPRTFAALSGG
jgi:hypothetical protein